MVRMHASCVAIDGAGVLLRGPSGAGKSDLALRLIDGGALLVADDQVELEPSPQGHLFAAPPPALAGRLEVYGIGILEMDHLADVPVRLLVDLVSPAAVERLPEPRRCLLAGIAVPAIALAPFEASASAKLRLALRDVTSGHASVSLAAGI